MDKTDHALAVMLTEGTLSGPYRRPHPVTLNARTSFLRWVAKKERQCDEFVDVYRQYRAHHSPLYAARIAYGIAFTGLPF